VFQKVDAYAGDPILSLMERFKEDPRSDKVNLSIGLYYNEDGIIPQLQAVAEAEARLNAEPHGASLYLPMEGLNAIVTPLRRCCLAQIIRCWRKNAWPPFRRWAVRAR
jgi:aromatic-amino-acid transaminase